MTVKPGSYIVVPAFATNDLHLKGNELLVFSVIWGFSQDGSSWFRGSRGYLASWCGASKGTVDNVLAKLAEKGLVEKRKRIENGVTLCDYRVPQGFYPRFKNCDTPPQNLGGGTPKTEVGGTPKITPHTIEVDSLEDTPRESEGAQRKRFTPPTPDEVAAYAAEKGYASFDAARFVSYYESNGWRVGRNPMKSWRAAVDGWHRRDKQASAPRGGGDYDPVYSNL